MKGSDRDGAEVEAGTVRYARSGARSASQTQRGRSLERDLLIKAGIERGMSQSAIARAMGIAQPSVNRRINEMGLDRA